MSFHLDPQTVYISLICGHVFTVILLSAYRRSESKERSVSLFFTAKLIQAAAWTVMLLRINTDSSAIISLSNTLMFIGTAFEAVALLNLQSSLSWRTARIYIGVTSAAILIFNGILFFHNIEVLRIAAASFFSALLIIPPALRLLRKKSGGTALRRLMGILYTFVAGAMLVRTGSSLLGQGAPALLSAPVAHDLFSISAYLTMILGNTGFVLLAKQKADEELVYLASVDDLTQIWNRRTFLKKADVMLSRCAKRKTPVSFLLFDIDGFKGINDTHGHDVGDRVLKEMSQIVSRQLEPEDLFGRYGGDEFAVLIPGLSVAESTLKAERIRAAVEGAYTLSIGALTFVPDDRSDLDRIYKCCDLALYDAKQAGRNQVKRAEGHFEVPAEERQSLPI
ncbi:GGDEF domain-containing protein [Saccharibacillus kuerlensis]|uniref:GGDEF domain-containing protein n=1 Tax=Saccharibacillus kuerlensis TaxID=459527 RepID=A0ABQ2L6R2_9BACL|nr:GGDEF domain-containing protein [Saccharibacillus kuerlensis]GGO02935.1 GGDEF domain-containing protein [Saccharibacillus kuerlensis]